MNKYDFLAGFTACFILIGCLCAYTNNKPIPVYDTDRIIAELKLIQNQNKEIIQEVKRHRQILEECIWTDKHGMRYFKAIRAN